MRTIPQLRAALGWSQDQMAQVLGCRQPTVDRIEGGQSPSGAAARLAERLDHLFEAGTLTPAMPVAEAIRLVVGRESSPATSLPANSPPQLQSA